MCLVIAVADPKRVLGKGAWLGFEWVVTHNGMGCRCGYVRVPVGHAWHGTHYGDLDEVDAHGGLTFSEPDYPCENGAADDGWWIGFDCAHSMDAQDPTLPNEVVVPSFGGGEIRTQEYVEFWCRYICLQAKVKQGWDTSIEGGTMSEKNKEQLIECARAGIVIGDGSEQMRALIEELDSRPTVVAVRVGTDEKCVLFDDGLHSYGKRGLVYSIDVGYGSKTWRFESVSLSEITNSDIRYAD